MKKTKRILSFVLCATLAIGSLNVFSLKTSAVTEQSIEDNEFQYGTKKGRLTPLMGWASWNGFHCEINEELIHSQIDKLVSLGLRDKGYTFMNIDDGWQDGRGDDGIVKTNEKKFPKGMKEIADYAHANGMSAGTYTDAGIFTCGWQCSGQKNNDNVGLLGYDESDLNRYLNDWGFDFIKVDWCGGTGAKCSPEKRYCEVGEQIAKIEKQTGKDKIYNICCWSFPGQWALPYADSWRTGGDIAPEFNNILKQIDNVKNLADYVGPGHVNDLDMLQVGNGMSYDEDKTHFSMWCMMSSPLMLGNDLRSITDETLSIISNDDLIAIDQDKACLQARVAVSNSQFEIWQKPLGSEDSNTKAIAIMNRSNDPVTVPLDFKSVGLSNVGAVKDLWLHQDISVGDKYTVELPPHGVVVLKATGDKTNTENQLMADDAYKVDTVPTADKDTLIDSYSVEKKEQSPIAKETSKTQIIKADEKTATVDVNQKGNAKVFVKGTGEVTLTATMSGQTIKKTTTLEDGMLSEFDLFYQCYDGAQIALTLDGDGAFTDITADKGVTKSICKSPLNSVMINDKLSVKQKIVGGLSEDGTDPQALNYMVAYYNKDNRLVSAGCVQYKPQSLPADIQLELDAKGVKEGYVCTYLLNDKSPVAKPYKEDISFVVKQQDDMIGPVTARDMVEKGATLLDVRTDEEYDQGHLDGAKHLEYTKVMDHAAEMFPDKDQVIITYCSMAKRSVQALRYLKELGYTNVYSMGSMDNYNVNPFLQFKDPESKICNPGDNVELQFYPTVDDVFDLKLSLGADSTIKDAVPADEFKIPETTDSGVVVKAYSVYKDKVINEIQRRFLVNGDNLVDIYATDLKFTKQRSAQSVKKNKSTSGNPISINGKQYDHGLGIHADSDVRMLIPDGAKEFIAVAGVDDEVLEGGSKDNKMKFSILIDDELVGAEQTLIPGEEFVFDVQIPEGAKEIALIANQSYDANYSDHGDWGICGFKK